MLLIRRKDKLVRSVRKWNHLAVPLCVWPCCFWIQWSNPLTFLWIPPYLFLPWIPAKRPEAEKNKKSQSEHRPITQSASLVANDKKSPQNPKDCLKLKCIGPTWERTLSRGHYMSFRQERRPSSSRALCRGSWKWVCKRRWCSCAPLPAWQDIQFWECGR